MTTTFKQIKTQLRQVRPYRQQRACCCCCFLDSKPRAIPICTIADCVCHRVLCAWCFVFNSACFRSKPSLFMTRLIAKKKATNVKHAQNDVSLSLQSCCWVSTDPFSRGCLSPAAEGDISSPYSKLSSMRKKSTHKVPMSASRAVVSRMQRTLHATRRTPHGASLLVHAISAWSMKAQRAPFRHGRDARVYFEVWSYGCRYARKLGTHPLNGCRPMDQIWSTCAGDVLAENSWYQE